MQEFVVPLDVVVIEDFIKFCEFNGTTSLTISEL
jgi:hypothetical protein